MLLALDLLKYHWMKLGLFYNRGKLLSGPQLTSNLPELTGKEFVTIFRTQLLVKDLNFFV